MRLQLGRPSSGSSPHTDRYRSVVQLIARGHSRNCDFLRPLLLSLPILRNFVLSAFAFDLERTNNAFTGRRRLYCKGPCGTCSSCPKQGDINANPNIPEAQILFLEAP